jgi:hypothetical protein
VSSSPHKVLEIESDPAQPGDYAVDKFGDVHMISKNDSQSFINTCSRVLVSPDQIPTSILNLIKSGEIKEFNRVAIEVELVVNVATEKEDEVYHKIKLDKDNKVNVVSYERFLDGTGTVAVPKATNELLQLMHDTMSPVNSIKGAIFLLKPMIAEKLKENNELLGEIFTGTHKSKDDEFLALLAKLMDGIETKANQLNEVLDAYYNIKKS